MKEIQFFYKDSAGASEADIERGCEQLDEYRRYFNEVAAKGECVCGEASINVAFDSEALTTVTALCDQLQNPKLKFVVVVGIGGYLAQAFVVQGIYQAGDYPLPILFAYAKLNYPIDGSLAAIS